MWSCYWVIFTPPLWISLKKIIQRARWWQSNISLENYRIFYLNFKHECFLWLDCSVLLSAGDGTRDRNEKVYTILPWNSHCPEIASEVFTVIGCTCLTLWYIWNIDRLILDYCRPMRSFHHWRRLEFHWKRFRYISVVRQFINYSSNSTYSTIESIKWLQFRSSKILYNGSWFGVLLKRFSDMPFESIFFHSQRKISMNALQKQHLTEFSVYGCLCMR